MCSAWVRTGRRRVPSGAGDKLAHEGVDRAHLVGQAIPDGQAEAAEGEGRKKRRRRILHKMRGGLFMGRPPEGGEGLSMK